MAELRRWRIDKDAPYALYLAADARLSQTDNRLDQVWELLLSQLDTPALMLRSRYDDRAGEVSASPSWWHDNRSIALHQTYQKPPVVTAFAPGYIRAEAQLTPHIALIAEHWAMESSAVGVRYMLTNNGAKPESIRADVRVIRERDRARGRMAILTLSDGVDAISTGRFDDLEPVIVLEGGRNLTAEGRTQLGATLNIPAGESVRVRWVHVGLSRMAASVDRAFFWLGQDWDGAFAEIVRSAQAIPQIETGDIAQDLTIAFSYQTLMQSVVRATDRLPNATFVNARQPATPPAHALQALTAHNAYLAALGAAAIDPALAQGVVKNFLASQSADGSIDLSPGTPSGLLCPPLLARLTWHIYQLTEDLTFIKAAYPRLLAFFNRWSAPEIDADFDILPEYQDERQTGYALWPMFGLREAWAQNADIQFVETPDMAAYLLSECVALASIAREIGDPGAYELTNRLVELRRLLEAMWRDDLNRYAYQDRDSHRTLPRVDVLNEVRADEEHIIALDFPEPARLIVRLMGGTSRPPKASITLFGASAEGEAITETLLLDANRWGYSFGTAVSTSLFSRIDRITSEGLSRVYKMSVHTVDYTRLDINAVLPLLLDSLPDERAAPLIALLTDPAHFRRSSGLTIVSAQDADFDPAGADGGGGVWAYWLTLIAEGLLGRGRADLATDLVKALLKTQTAVLKEKNAFTRFYHADSPVGIGTGGHISGIVPVYLLLRLLGVQIMSDRRVYVGGAYHWGNPVTVRAHGVAVTRSDKGAKIVFPTGYTVEVGASEGLQLIEDTNVSSAPGRATPNRIEPPTNPLVDPLATTSAGRVIIDVQTDE